MTYMLLTGMFLGKIVQILFDFHLDFCHQIWPLPCALFVLFISPSNYKIIFLFSALIFGLINSLTCPKFANISVPSTQIISTGFFHLSSKQGIICFEKKSYLVEGISLTPGSSGAVERGFFKKATEKNSSQPNIRLWSDTIKSFILSATCKLSASIKHWFEALFLGTFKSLPSDIQKTLKFLGIYHIAVISGLHFNLLSSILNRFIHLPINFLYAFKVISPPFHSLLKVFSELIFLIILIIYAELLSFSQPVQRALITFVVGKVHWLFHGKVKFSRLIPHCLCLQALFFPLGFFHMANFMSWAAYLILISPELRIEAHSIWSKLIKQLLLSLLAASLFGELSLLGLIINPLLGGALPSLLVSGLVLIFIQGHLPQVEDVIISYHHLFLKSCIIIYENLSIYNILYIKFNTHNTLRLMIGFAVLFFTLIIYCSKPISSHAHNKS